MARRAFLHLGTPKSGTTYLQSLWWHNRTTLADRGLLLPGEGPDEQFRAAAVVRANADVLSTMTPEQRGAWDRVAAQTAEWSGDVLISQEQLVEAPEDQAADAVRRLAEAADEVHLVVTGRDLVRQVPSAWQQRVKHGSSSTLRRFCRRLAKDDPDFNFWRHQDLTRILERWGADLAPDRVHLVVLPPRGASPDLLWTRTCRLLGLDDTGLDLAAPVANETLSPAQIAFWRLVNTHFPDAHREVARSRRLKGYLEPRLGSGRGADRSARAARLVLPEDLHPWFVERGNRMADELSATPWHVVGDLEDLRPDPERGEGVDPDRVPEDEVLACAVELIADLLLEEVADGTPVADGSDDAAGSPGSAVGQPRSQAREGGWGTALTRAVRRLAGRR